MSYFRPAPFLFCKAVTSCFFLALMLLSATSSAQAITHIYTDFNGYYSSGVGSISSTIPNRSQNLLAFTYNGVTYTTGVNDVPLGANNITRIQGNYRSLPASSIGGTVGASTYLLIPAADDGVTGGTVAPYPALRIIDVLTDGVRGLNIGSGVTNLPKTSSLTFPVDAIDPASITDTKPDIMYTQVAATTVSDPPDTVFFENSTGGMVGNSILVGWGSISIVGSHSCDLYTLSAGSCDVAVVNGVNSNSQPKDFRLTAFRLSEFGINTVNAPDVVRLIIKPGGTSDLAFVAYNVDAFTVLGTVPVRFTGIDASLVNKSVRVTWQTGFEVDNDRFIVERSTDGQMFLALGTVAAIGNSSDLSSYSFTDTDYPAGTLYYRVRQVDSDGRSEISPVVVVQVPSAKTSLLLLPNPASGSVVLQHPRALGTEKIAVLNSGGVTLSTVSVSAASTETRISLGQLSAGIYQVVWINGGERISKPLVVK